MTGVRILTFSFVCQFIIILSFHYLPSKSKTKVLKLANHFFFRVKISWWHNSNFIIYKKLCSIMKTKRLDQKKRTKRIFPYKKKWQKMYYSLYKDGKQYTIHMCRIVIILMCSNTIQQSSSFSKIDFLNLKKKLRFS